MTAENMRSLEAQIRSFMFGTGAQLVNAEHLGRGPLAGMFEDRLTVVGYAVFESTDELLNTWINAQDQMANAIGRSDFDLGAKAWDGYLILATGQTSTPDQSAHLTSIRSNTRRLRKILVLGEDLEQRSGKQSVESAIARALAPLAPLELGGGGGAADPLAGLGHRLDVPGLDRADIEAVVAAYRESRPLIQVLHERGRRVDQP
jgi:hypothetical protein